MIAQLYACDPWTDSVAARDVFFVPINTARVAVTFEAAASVPEDDYSDILRSRALEQEVLDILDA